MQADSQDRARQKRPAGRPRGPTLTVLRRSTARADGAVHELRLAAQRGPDFARVDAPATSVDGSVRARVEPEPAAIASPFYRESSETLISGAPVAEPMVPPRERAWRRLNAKDLVAELNSINTQVKRIMSQVERAVAKLATTS